MYILIFKPNLYEDASCSLESLNDTSGGGQGVLRQQKDGHPEADIILDFNAMPELGDTI